MLLSLGAYCVPALCRALSTAIPLKPPMALQDRNHGLLFTGENGAGEVPETCPMDKGEPGFEPHGFHHGHSLGSSASDTWFFHVPCLAQEGAASLKSREGRVSLDVPLPPLLWQPCFQTPLEGLLWGLALNQEGAGGASGPTSPPWGLPENQKALCRGGLPLVTPMPVPVQVIKDLKGSDYSWSYQTPPSSPSGSGSRKSSMCRSVRG